MIVQRDPKSNAIAEVSQRVARQEPPFIFLMVLPQMKQEEQLLATLTAALLLCILTSTGVWQHMLICVTTSSVVADLPIACNSLQDAWLIQHIVPCGIKFKMEIPAVLSATLLVLILPNSWLSTRSWIMLAAT